MMIPVLFRDELDQTECDAPDCPGDSKGDFYIYCHPDGLDAHYIDGLIVLSCRGCHDTVAQIAVARKQ